MVYDYYDFEQYINEEQIFLRFAKKYGKKNPYNDVCLSYLQCPYQLHGDNSNGFRINIDSYLFHLLKRYVLCSKKERIQFLKHPYINSITKDGNIYSFETEFGNVCFSFWIRGLIDIVTMSINNRNHVSIAKSLQRYKEEYDRKNNGICHNRAFCFGHSGIITTAFVNSPLIGYKYLHSFLERENDIIDVTANIVLSIDDYYNLLKPEVLTKVTLEELVTFVNDCKDKYPSIGKLPIVQLLAEYNEIKKDPSKVKIKSFYYWKMSGEY